METTNDERNNGPELPTPQSKLHLDHNNLFGRSEETNAFRQVLAQVRRHPAPPQFLLVHGNSGCGKTALVRHLQMEESESDDIIWVDGKYDQFDHGSRQFGAIAEATSELLQKLKQSEIDAILEDIDEKDVLFLAKVMNAFNVLLSEDYNTEDSTETVNEHALTTFGKHYGKFLNLVCSLRTVVMFLDDLQWFDPASLKLLASIAADKNLRNFLLVGGRRDDDGRNFELEASSEMSVNRIEIYPLDISGTKELVATAVGASLEDAAELGATLHSKAGGNPFFVVQMLENLVQTRVLKRDAEGVFSWKMSKVVEKTNVGDNIVKLLLSRIDALPRTTQAVLFVAAQWGFRFHIRLVEVAFKSPKFLDRFGFEEDEVDVTKAMANAIVNGLVEKSRHGTYRFTHDRVQQSAIALVASRESGEKFNSVMEQFGLVLFQKTQEATKRDRDRILFTALRVLLSHPSIPFSEMAVLCGKGATVSARKFSFEQGLKYSESGIEYLVALQESQEGVRLWAEHYETALDLFSISAEMNYVAGNFELCKERIACVARHAIDARDTMRSQIVMLDMLSWGTNWIDCTTTGTKLLRHFGIKIHLNSGTMAVAWNLMTTKSLVGGRTAKDLKSLPSLRDPDKQSVLRVLAQVTASTWMSQKDNTSLIASLHMFRVTLKHGFSPFGVYALSTYANVVSIVHGDHETAWDFADLSVELAEKRFDEARCMISYALTMYLGFNRRGIAWSISWLRKAIDSGIRSGYYSLVSGNIWALGSLLLYTSPLPVRKRLNELGRQLFVEYIQPEHQLFRPWAQLSETLETGGVSLNGTFFRVDDFQPNEDDFLFVNVVHYANVFLFTILCDYESLLKEEAQYQGTPGTAEFGLYLPKITCFFHLALSFFAMARQKTSKKDKHKAIRYAAEVRGLTIGPAPFLRAMNILLAAEEKTMKSKTAIQSDELLTMYTEAAELFDADECTLYRAMTLEKAGDFCVRIGDADGRGNKFLLEAYDLFAEFGVASKLPLLRAKYPQLVDNADSAQKSSAVWNDPTRSTLCSI